MDRFLQDLRHATRVLAKSPGFTFVVIFTLAVGIGANTAMFSIVNGVLLEGLPFRDPERIVDLNEVERAERNRGAIAPATFADWQRLSTTIETMAAYRSRTYNVDLTNGEPERLPGAMTSSTFFDVLGVAPILGRQFARDDAEPGKGRNVVLSYGFWQRRFGGSPDAINQTVRLNGAPYTVVGVMPVTVNFPQGANFWVPAAYDLPADGVGPDPRGERGAHYLRAIGRMKDGQTLDRVNAELSTISDQLGAAYPDESAHFIGIARPLQDQLVGAARTPLLVLLGAVGCVLLIVVANVANLLMARATVRARELAIRAAVGADRAMLMRQLLTESVLLAVVGGVLGVVPAWQASRPELQSALKESSRGTTGDGHRQYARAGLVLAEVSLSLVLLVGAGLLFRSLMTLIDMPLGFVTDRVLTMQVAPTGENYRSPGPLITYWTTVLERAQAVPGVEAVALTTGLPMSGGRSLIAFNVEGRPQAPLSQQPLAFWVEVSPGYFRALGIPVVRGREFERQDAVEQPVSIVVNEAMARREFPDQDPIGRRFSFGPGEDGQPQWVTIVGVVANVRQYRADQDPVPMAYGVHTGSAQAPQNLVVRTAGDPMTVAAAVTAAVQAIDASLPLTPPRTLGAVIGASLTQRRFNMTLLAVFAGIALVLAIAGIYGTVSYAVAQRNNEIGIRVALGATKGEILRLVLADALKPVAGGLVVGLGAAVALTRALERLVFGVSTTDAVTFVSLPVLLALVAFLASLVPALRATRVDPLDALRMD